MKRVLVTGAAGFAGQYLIEELLQRGYQVGGTYYRTDAPADDVGPVSWHRCDVRRAESVKQVVHDFRPDGVIHLAAMSVPTRANADPIQAYATNVGGWLHLLEAVHAAGLNCRLVLVSSCHVYGQAAAGCSELSEDAPVRPVDVYGATRAAAETLASVYGKPRGMQIVVARSFNHCGPRQRAEYFVASVARQAARIALSLDPPRMVLGNLNVVRDFCDVRDVVRAYVELLERGESGQVYNVCSGAPTELRMVVERLRDIAGCSFDVAADPGLMRKADAPRIVGDCSRLAGATGWRPRISLELTIRDTFEWHLSRCRQDLVRDVNFAASGSRGLQHAESSVTVDAVRH